VLRDYEGNATATSALLQQGLDVRECQEGRKLFVWQQSGSRKIGPRALPPGPRPNFCTATHANTYAKRERRKAVRRLEGREAPTYEGKENPETDQQVGRKSGREEE
jgi:hypothetical protein